MSVSGREDVPFQYQQALLNFISKKRGRLAQPLRNAFLAIPRHMFISAYYQRKGKSLEWEKILSPGVNASLEERQTWYEIIYSDEVLVTQIDVRGYPISSSSQPNIMAQMLEALSISPGHAALEIGTGTGYNAALLSYLVGETGSVISLELDDHLANSAHSCICDVTMSVSTDKKISLVQVIATNALTWQSPHLFDRIIATASYDRIPFKWLQMLNHDGILVMEWRGAWTGSLLNIYKGQIGYEAIPLPDWQAGFMPLREDIQHTPSAFSKDTNVIETHTFSVELFNWHEIEQNQGLLFWLQHHLPDIKKRHHTSRETGLVSIHLIDEQQETMAILSELVNQQGWSVTVHGRYPLWTKFFTTYQRWFKRGQPTLEHYTLKISDDGQVNLMVH